jgi:hypothetical protein
VTLKMPTRQKDKKLLAAVVAGNYTDIKACIKNKANPDMSDSNKTPVLHLIIQSPNLSLSETCKLIDLFVDYDVDLNKKDKSGKTVLDHARNFPAKQAVKMISLLKECGAVDRKQVSKYITYENNEFFSNGKRPTNQSKPKVQQKIAARLTRFEREDGLKMTSLQKQFTEEVEENKSCKLKDNNIDIAHNIACAKLGELIIAKMNTDKDPVLEEKFTEFIEDFLSTDDESGKEEANKIYHNLSKEDLEPVDRMADAVFLFEHLNRASKNLMPGHSSPNQALHNHRDPHLMKSRGAKLVETPVSKCLSKSIDTLFGRKYHSRSRKINGQVEHQSSSIHSDKDRSWYKPNPTPN